jgi:hypothetical protein
MTEMPEYQARIGTLPMARNAMKKNITQAIAG